MTRAHTPDSHAAAAPAKAPTFSVSLEPHEAQALLAIVGLTKGDTLHPLYAALEDFHAAHGIERKEVSEVHDIGGFDVDNLIEWWTADEARAGEPVSAA